MRSLRIVLPWSVGIAWALTPGSAAATQEEEYGVVFRTPDAIDAPTDRIQVQSSVDVARVLLVNSYLDSGGQRIQGVGTPTAGSDAATKAYVDNAVGPITSRWAAFTDGTTTASAVGGDTFTLAASPGLLVAVNAISKSITYSPAFGGTGAAATIARSDHVHATLSAGAGLLGGTYDGSGATTLALDTTVTNGLYVNDGGDTMTGNLTLPDPTAAGHAVNQGFADTTYVNVSGDTMTGVLTVAGLAVAAATSLDLNANPALDLVAEGFTAATEPLGPQPEGRVIWRTDLDQLRIWDGASTWVPIGGSGAGILSLNGLTVSAQTLGTGTSGTAPNWASAGPSHTLNIPMASVGGVTAGLLANADYTTFAGSVDSVTATGPLSSSGGQTPNVSLAGTVGVANGGTGANLSGTGGAGQYVKQETSGGVFTVGTIPAGDIPDLSASYVTLSGVQAVSGAKTFSAAPSFTAGGAPFSVTGTTLVANLNADLFDGLDSTAFMAAGTDNWVNTTGDTMAGALTMNTGVGTDAAISETGLNRASGGAETFNIQNSGGGTMTLQVGGVIESTTGGFKFPDGTTQATAAAGTDGLMYGNGSDGDATIAANTDLGTTNIRFYNNLTVNGGVNLTGNTPLVIYVKGTLTLNGTIHVNGKGASGGAGAGGGGGGGAGGGSVFILAKTIAGNGTVAANGASGGGGGPGSSAGDPDVTWPGSAGTNGAFDPLSSTPSGGAGNAGGAGGWNAGGGGGALKPAYVVNSTLEPARLMHCVRSPVGSGGGGGGGGLPGTSPACPFHAEGGGGGGSGGSFVGIGGAGGGGGTTDPSAGGGGGGGGSGGVVFVLSDSFSTAASVQARGGAGGSGFTAAGAGGGGSGGMIVVVANAQPGMDVAGGSGANPGGAGVARFYVK